MFKGSIVAIVTPFYEGKVDEKSFKELLDFQIENGTDAIVPCGTTGESATLSYDEHERVIALAVEHVAGRVPVIAGTGSNSTKEAIKLTKFAKKIGADGCLMITPYYNKPTQNGLYEHYKKVAEEVDIPIILYNVPSRTGINMEPETVARLSEIKNIVGIKEASGSLRQISEIINLVDKDFSVISGDDFITYPLLALGGKGVISVTANICPNLLARMCDAFFEGKIDEARDLHYKLWPLHKAMFLETNPIPVKAALELMGKISGEVRLPLTKLSEKNREKLKEVLSKFDLIRS